MSQGASVSGSHRQMLGLVDKDATLGYEWAIQPVMAGPSTVLAGEDISYYYSTSCFCLFSLAF